jgi:hypothetical protein
MNELAKTQIITDDLDGSPNAETVRFGLDGRTYEIDLATKNRVALAKALEKYIEKASQVRDAPRALRVVSTSATKAPRANKSSTELTRAADDRTARRWALATGLKINGRPVGSKGRLHPDARAAWQKAGKPKPPQ